MNKEELQRELDWMQRMGLHPLWCNTPVPVVDVPVLAGQPRAAGDVTPGQYVMVPRELLGHHPVFLIDVDGYSMRDAGIMPGDRLEVELDSNVADGDIVLAEVDGDCTVKTFFTDDQGVKWLVPCNDDFDAIRLEGHQWRVVGKVTGLRKGIPRTTFADCVRSVDRRRTVLMKENTRTSKSDMPKQPELMVLKAFHQRRRIDYNLVRQRLEQVLVKQMRHRYEWYAAYRMMMDLHLLDELQLTKFAQQMNAWFPEAPIPCTADSLGDYAVGHTSKAFSLWDSDTFRRECRKSQSLTGFTTLFHRCEELRAALFPLPLVEMELPF